ncbi:hypothetical protein DOY81_009437 [Sarcophaga bullata]|nr:hypothetical protein DOY81_009437 [Sarcophaga bullata]
MFRCNKFWYPSQCVRIIPLGVKTDNCKDTDIKQSQAMSEKMRSRTEMVTTTFVDSEEDYSDDDDSEEDWRPSASNKNGKKQKQQKGIGGGTAKRGRKRRSSSVIGNKNLKRKLASEESDECEDEPSGDDYDCDDFDTTSGSSNKKPLNLPPKKQFSDKNSSILGKMNEKGDILNLLLYVKDLSSADPNINNRLCLWRKDSNNLLQKYIRVKTAPDQFLFTSSSVYSSFDDKRISDFYDVKVKSIDSSYRRVQILNPSELKKIAKSASKIKEDNKEGENILVIKNPFPETNKTNCVESKKKNTEPSQNDTAQDTDEENVVEENEEDDEDCLLEDDEEDIEEDDEDEGEDD